jgi:glycosyltransferase involved in cell wall biosynthesis
MGTNQHLPFVLCVMLTKDRPEMARRAIRAFKAQTYPVDRRALYVLNTGRSEIGLRTALLEDNHYACYGEAQPLEKLCHQMNEGMARALQYFEDLNRVQIDFLAKWDDDDWSHPERIARQVAAVKMCSSPVAICGFNEMPFLVDDGRVMLYRNPSTTYVLGTSMLISRRAWSQMPFPETASGKASDTVLCTQWAARGQVLAMPVWGNRHDQNLDLREPLMVATMHSGNTSASLDTKMATEILDPQMCDWIRRAML